MKKTINYIFNKKLNEKNIKHLTYIYCLLNAFIFLFVCSKCSPFYPINNWVDANSYFTMGKGMANGLIIYKDLFEQKGPLLYLIHGISYLISNDTFIGVFIFEVISFSIFLYYINKIISLYSRKIHLLWVTPAISFIILSSYVLIGGDSAEEFCFPFLAFIMYQMLNYYKNIYPNKMGKKQLIISGITAGCVFCIKYNLLGFWFGFIFFLCLGLLINKKVKDAFYSGLYFLLGMLIAIIPWIIYFAVNGALYDFFNVYFIVNLSSYSEKETILRKLVRPFENAWIHARNFVYCTTITVGGYFYVMISKKIIPKIYGKIAITFSIIITIIAIYFGTNHVYYYLFLMPFVVLGFIAISCIIEKIIKAKWLNYTIFLIPIFIATFVALSCYKSENFEFHNVKKEDLAQFQFAKIIKEKPNATLLNYGCLDGGFYTTSNIVPNIKHFHKPNISYESYPEIMDEQNRYIKEKVVDFVVVMVEKEEDSKNISYLYENYENVKSVFDKSENKFFMLFELK